MVKGFTIIELIFTIVIFGIISGISMFSLSKTFDKKNKIELESKMMSNTNVISSHIENLLYNRIPYSILGYNSTSQSLNSIYTTNGSYDIVEWIGYSKDSNIDGVYSTFIDLDSSIKATNNIVSPLSNGVLLEEYVNKSWNKVNSISNNNLGLVFAGSFDDGTVKDSSEFLNMFGWHGNPFTNIFTINSFDSNGNIKLNITPYEIFERYYIADSGYSLARGESVDLLSPCISSLNLKSIDENSLFLFTNYRPWKNETFCGDKNIINTEAKSGEVYLLSNDITSFQLFLENEFIKFRLTMESSIGGLNALVSKEKVIY